MNKQQQQQRLRSPLFLHGRSHSSELQQQKTGDLIIVSNRLPVTLEQGSNSNEFAFKKSSGGLVTALTGMNKEFKWLGWLGEEITQQEKQQQLKTELYEKHKYWPVFLNKQDAADYYNGFSNGILWPMFHYLHQRNATFNEKQVFWRKKITFHSGKPTSASIKNLPMPYWKFTRMVIWCGCTITTCSCCLQCCVSANQIFFWPSFYIFRFHQVKFIACYRYVPNYWKVCWLPI